MKTDTVDALKTYLTDVFSKCGISPENTATAQEWRGLDKGGNLTTDPMAMAEGTRYPIGAHKGSACVC